MAKRDTYKLPKENPIVGKAWDVPNQQEEPIYFRIHDQHFYCTVNGQTFASKDFEEVKTAASDALVQGGTYEWTPAILVGSYGSMHGHETEFPRPFENSIRRVKLAPTRNN